MSRAPRKNSIQYVREQRNLSREALAKELGTSPKRLASFEAGEREPTERQLRQLERILGIPDYQLISAATPNLEPLVLDFRKEVAAPLETSPKGLQAYFHREGIASTLAYLASALEAEKHVSLPTNLRPVDLVSNVEKTLSQLEIDPSRGDLIDSPDQALRVCRYALERANMFSFMVAVPQIDYRGLFAPASEDWDFCLINKRTFKAKARLFTLFHELGHLLTSRPGASDPFVLHNDLERACNAFASHALAPSTLFDEIFRQASARQRATDDVIRYVSARCLLSMGATAYRLRSEDRISAKDFNSWFERNGVTREYGAEDPNDEADDAEAGGGNYAYNVISDVGYMPILLAKKALESGLIDEADVGRIINARGDTQELVFETVDKRVAEFGFES